LRSWARFDALERISRAPLPDLDGLARLANHHRVDCLAHRAIAAHPAGVLSGDEDVSLLAAARQTAVVEHLRALATLRRVQRALDPDGIPWFVVKGPVLAEHAYGDPSLRRCADVDVIVPPDRFAQALGALERASGTCVQQDFLDILAAGAGEIDLSFGDATPSVDLHWHILVRREERERFPIPISELLERAVPSTLGDSIAISTFEPTDAALHLSWHACFAGAHKLGWLVDIDRQVRSAEPDWDAFVERARRWKVALPVGLALERTAHALGTPVPNGVRAALLPSRSFRTALWALDAVRPTGSRLEGIGVPARLARLARPTPRATAAAVVATGWRRATSAGTAPAREPVPPFIQRDARVAWLSQVRQGSAA
jgi:hypothetical protein